MSAAVASDAPATMRRSPEADPDPMSNTRRPAIAPGGRAGTGRSRARRPMRTPRRERRVRIAGLQLDGAPERRTRRRDGADLLEPGTGRSRVWRKTNASGARAIGCIAGLDSRTSRVGALSFAACPDPPPSSSHRRSRSAFLVAVDTGDDGGWTAEESLAELANLATTAGAEVVGAEWQNRRHVDPQLVHRQGQGRGARRGQVARPASTSSSPTTSCRPAQQKALEEPAQRQGHRPQPADPRHLRPARPDPRGPPPGRARPARVPAAAPDPAVDPPVADRRRDRHPGTRREPARDRPADHPRPDQEDEGAGRAGPPARARRRRAAAIGG